MYETKLVATHPPRVAYTRSHSEEKIDFFFVMRSALLYLTFILAGILVHSLLEPFLQGRMCHTVDSFLSLTRFGFFDLPQYMSGLWMFLRADAVWLIGIYVCAFSYLFPFLSNVFLASRGLSLGASLGYVAYALNHTILPPKIGACLIIKEAIVSAILLFALAHSMRLYSRLRALGDRQYGAMLAMLLAGCLQCVLFISAIMLIAILFSFLL